MIWYIISELFITMLNIRVLHSLMFEIVFFKNLNNFLTICEGLFYFSLSVLVLTNATVVPRFGIHCLYFDFRRWLVVEFTSKAEVFAAHIVTVKTELVESVENLRASGFDIKFIATCMVRALG